MQLENERDARLELAQRMSQTAELVPQSAFLKVTTVYKLISSQLLHLTLSSSIV